MKYVTTYKTKSYDLNLRNELKPTELDQYLQESADRQIAEFDAPYDVLVNERGVSFILSRIGIEIYSGIDRCGELEGRTWVSEGRAANFPRTYELYHKGNLVAKAFSNWALVDVATKKLIKNGDYDMSMYPFDEPPEMIIPARFRIPKDIELSKVAEYRVGYSQTDINRHMNNTQYLNQITDHIPGVEDMTFTSINLRYVHEAPYKSNVDIYMSDFVEPGDIDPRAERIIYIKTMVGDDVNLEAVFGVKTAE